MRREVGCSLTGVLPKMHPSVFWRLQSYLSSRYRSKPVSSTVHIEDICRIGYQGMGMKETHYGGLNKKFPS